MSSIPYDLLPSCDPDFAHMKLKQKQSFVNRFFGFRACDSDKQESNLTALYSRNTSRAFSSATSSTNSSYISLNSKASSSSMQIPMATPRRPRANTAASSTSVASFVSQTSSVHSSASYSSLRSRSPSRERREAVEDGWTPVEEYF